MKSFSLVVAVDKKSGIGKNGGLPWHLPVDMKHFKTVTTAGPKENVVIMGRKTWDSIPEKFRPLPGRLNIVISRQKDFPLPKDVRLAHSLQDALALLEQKKTGDAFVIGGGQIFGEAFALPACQKLYVTHVDRDFSCDTFFPEISRHFQETSRQGPVLDQGIPLYFCEYSRKH